MGLGGISVWQLLIILAIVLVLFGAKRLRNLGSDLGNAVKGFKTAVRDGEEESKGAEGQEKVEEKDADRVIEGQVSSKEKHST